MTKRFKGIGAAPGLAIGQAVIRRPQQATTSRAASPEVERGRLALAAEKTRGQLRELAGTIATPEAGIFKAHLMLVDDPLLTGAINQHIEREGMSAEQAVEQAASAIAEKFDAMKDAYLRERAADIRDVGQRLLNNLGVMETGAAGAGILVARDLTPSETALVDRDRFLAVVTEEGGATGHAAILARALSLVAVFGAKGILSEIGDGDWLIVNGASGEVLLRPEADVLESYRKRMKAERLDSLRDLAAITVDGFRMSIAANIAGPGEAALALAAGAESIGVVRTEYLFMNRAEPPGEEEQFQAYRELLSIMAPRRVVIRTMDIGGDKDVACWRLPEEPNPALGMRGIRLSLAREEDFRCQLRALVRAAASGNLAILLPMINDISEVRRTREIMRELASDPIPLGVMVETPAAAILIEDLAGEADFFSVGTNDLVQYVLAADRAGGLYQPFHPAVLRLLRQVARAARAKGKHIAVCGEMAADPLAAPLFIGMEIDELSMSPSAIPAVKQAIRRTSKAAADVLLEDVLKLTTVAEIVARIAKEAG